MKLNRTGVTVEITDQPTIDRLLRAGYRVVEEPAPVEAKPPFMTVEQIRSAAGQIDNVYDLRALIEHEEAGKNRKTALEILHARLAELEEPVED